MNAVNQTRLQMETLNTQIDGYTIGISTDMEASLIRQYWQSLENLAPRAFFLRWPWVDTWLQTYRPELIVVTAHPSDDKPQNPVAIGLFTLSTQKRRFFIHSRQLRLNQTGNPDEDQIWVEFNEPLCAPNHQITAALACLKGLQQFVDEADEIVLSMTSLQLARNIQEHFAAVTIDLQVPAYQCNLAALRDSDQAFLDSLSSNSRYQVRRAMRRYQQRDGALQLQAAGTVEQALACFHEAGKLHRQRWADSGFHNPAFVAFHEHLIRNYFADGYIALLKITAGEKILGLLYYQISDNTAWFYLQGVCSESDAKFKPGLVAHALANQYFLEQGLDFYDYMGGDSQYKQQLAQRSHEQVCLTIQQPRIKFILEKLGRSLKKIIH